MSICAQAYVTVPFQDCDPMQVVWHGNYFRYLEEARRELLELLDFGYETMAEEGFAFPVIDTRMKYVAPARHKDKLRITATLVEWENRLKIDYRIVREADQQVCVKAYTSQVAVGLDDGEMRLASPQCLQQRVLACGVS